MHGDALVLLQWVSKTNGALRLEVMAEEVKTKEKNNYSTPKVDRTLCLFVAVNCATATRRRG